MTIKEDSLVVLAYSSNSCSTNRIKLSDLKSVPEALRSFDPKHLEIDLEKGIWSFGEWQAPIGQSRGGLGPWNRNRQGVIGVYDHFQIEHVKALVGDSHEALERPPYGYMASYD